MWENRLQIYVYWCVWKHMTPYLQNFHSILTCLDILSDDHWKQSNHSGKMLLVGKRSYAVPVSTSVLTI